jgi:hypothetical protein
MLPAGVGEDHPTYITWINSSKLSTNVPELTSMWCRYFHILSKILTFHYIRTKLWNQAHNRNRRRLGPFQHRLILSQKCQPFGRKLGEFFKRNRMRHRLLASASILCKKTSSLYCRLRMKASHGSPTCGPILAWIVLVALTYPWDADAKRAKYRKTARYADLKEKLSNQGWDCG